MTAEECGVGGGGGGGGGLIFHGEEIEFNNGHIFLCGGRKKWKCERKRVKGFDYEKSESPIFEGGRKGKEGRIL